MVDLLEGGLGGRMGTEMGGMEMGGMGMEMEMEMGIGAIGSGNNNAPLGTGTNTMYIQCTVLWSYLRKIRTKGVYSLSFS
jgi:hypothetical protein